MQFKFKLTLASGAVYFVDNVDSVLRVVDNNNANKNGRVISRIEYAPMIEHRAFFSGRRDFVTGTWYVTDAEELRRHDIHDIFDVDSRRDGSRLLIYATAITLIFIALSAWLILGDGIALFARLFMSR